MLVPLPKNVCYHQLFRLNENNLTLKWKSPMANRIDYLPEFQSIDMISSIVRSDIGDPLLIPYRTLAGAGGICSQHG